MNAITKPHVFIQVLFFLFSTSVISQEYLIREYGDQEGISQPFVYTVNQDAKGFIWAGTGEGLCRFDGYQFDADVIQDSVARTVAAISYKDRKGTLWFGFQSGDIIHYDGAYTGVIDTGEEIKSLITGFAELENGNMIVSTQSHGVFMLNVTTGGLIAVSGVEQDLYASLFLSEDLLLLGKQEGLALYQLGEGGTEAIFQNTIQELEYTKVQDIQKVTGKQAFWIATEDQGLYKLSLNNSGYEILSVGSQWGLEFENIQSVFEDLDGSLWLSTLGNGVFKIQSADTAGTWDFIEHYNKDNGLVSNLIKEVFRDQEGNIWVATYGGGVNILVPQVFSVYNFDKEGLNNDILSIIDEGSGTYYVGGQQGLFKMEDGLDQSIVKIAGIPADKVKALWKNPEYLFVGTENNGLYALHLSTSAVRSISYSSNSLGRSVNSVTGDQQYIYLGTKDGIYILDYNFSEVLHLTTRERLPHNNIECVFIDQQDRLLFATQTNGIYQYQLNDEGVCVNLYPAANTELEFKSIAEDDLGGIWAATYGNGVFYFRGDSVVQFTEESGLESNYCYSLVYTGNQSIWVGHSKGLSRINTNTRAVSTYYTNVGITGACNQNAVCVDHAGRALFGTNKGIIAYHPDQEETDKQPPFTNITGLMISDKEHDFNQDVVLPYDIYKLRIDFVGLDYSDPQTVTYQYKLEGYDLEWSDVTGQNYVIYPRIEDGSYQFLVRSYSNEGLTQETATSITIKVKLPFWKTYWFITLVVIILIFSVYLIIKIREQKQKQLQEYLEKELALRTKEVIEQKEVIEIKNKDITDSINYAKRIQNSMLPSVKKLKQNFSGCFVFYSPRDIVSGDFYWFDKINEEKFMIVCADSTGHGVPGAFMSMIGSTLIKDICTRVASNSPSKILQSLDLELGKMLNQNMEDGSKPSDGMDIIVCEINLKTYYLRYASAMRPMIIYRNGEEVFIRASRNSIGGYYERENNIFKDEGMQLGKGDIIYMFSDGYSDQFGGPMGKKFKTVRLKNLLQEIHDKPMEDQYNHVAKTFNNWKADYEQVDDVLFMGIKL